MKVTLVRPASIFSLNSPTPDVPPIGLAYLASALKKAGHSVAGVDGLGEALSQWDKVDGWPEVVRHGLSTPEIVRRIPEDTDLIGVRCMFSATWPYVRQVIEAIREGFPHVPIVVGGEHATALPAYILDTCQAVDYCIRGEGERALTILADVLAESGDAWDLHEQVPGIVLRIDGLIVCGPEPERIRRVDEIPEPDWSVFPIREYLDHGYRYGGGVGRSMPILATRRCPYKCAFCSSPRMWTTLWRARAPEEVVREMKKYIDEYHVDSFDFYDPTAILRKDWIIEFSKRVIRDLPPVVWQLASGTRSEALDAETIGYMCESGCRNITYAVESANEKTLVLIRKKIDPKKMLVSMRAACANNIEVKSHFLIGFPGEKKRDTLDNTRFLIKMARIGVQDITCSPFFPYPGSELFMRLEDEGRIALNNDYFRSLFDYPAHLRVESYSEYMSGSFIRNWNIANVAIFYAVSFIFHPVKAWHLVRNVFIRRHPVSWLERAIFRMVIQRWSIKRDLSP
uniref:Radical SAM superfamily enzyme YgiQ, UPF0313 family n=1 Tax=Candidatus Kentrum sp. MB TaxID=2138164 RepID=A0A451BH28_9GAMM|nr:MAG: Radical SAM superfamily enzyme YgiQ, UPF0313 family [Candidatus Kentron sp. MB]VFK35922.1 MAG: Radical SAM superfamily enzyme YgiQ, UPF0313 family [Candidatus Kentron sp. MB]VFK77567.1 MAG: Radical SAM superfamily enzyme YgiQ, UPF0313 family [Candidatus Kentron sp. MB]